MGVSCCWIVFLLSFTFLLNKYSVSGLIPVDEAKIRKFLTDYLDLEETLTGLVNAEDPNRFLAKYTDGTTASKSPSITLTQIAKLHISLQEGSATLMNNAPCDFTDELFVPPSTLAKSLAIDQLTTYYHYKALDDAAGKKYCNFFAYLVCQKDTSAAAAPGAHRCGCPSVMVWETNKCVFKNGERCDNQKNFDGQQFLIYNFFDSEFSNYVAPICAGDHHCPHWSHICQLDQFYGYHAPPKDIAAFLKTHVDGDPEYIGYDDELKTELLRDAMNDIRTAKRWADRIALSMELRTEVLLLEYGQACNFALDSSLFDTHLKTYTVSGSPFFRQEMLGEDWTRIQFQKAVIDAGTPGQICNHFKLLQCTAAGICDCKANLVWDSGTNYCTTKNTYPCSTGGNNMKLFRIRSTHKYITQDVLPPTWPSSTKTVEECDDYDYCDTVYVVGYTFDTKYFEFRDLKCESGSQCEPTLIPSGQQYSCLKPDDATSVMTLKYQFFQKCSLDLSTDCSATDHTTLFQPPSATTGTSYSDTRKAIEALVASPAKYCRIYEHATCSSTGKCTCVPPSIPQGTSCVAAPYETCGQQKSSVHQELDKLVLPLTAPGTESAANNLFCPDNLVCELDNFLKKTLCACQTGKHGKQCNIEPHYHVDHLELEYLPKSMQTPEARKLVSELHESMSQLEGTQTLKYDQPCDTQHHAEFETILSFLLKVRVACKCLPRKTAADKLAWDCDSYPCRNRLEFEKPKFDVLLQQAKDLVSKSPALCERTKGIRCVSNKCGCPKDFFYQDKEGECLAELGTRGVCIPVEKYNKVLATACRTGAMCVGDSYDDYALDHQCLSTNPVITGGKGAVSWTGSTSSYVTKVKKRFVEYLETHKNTLLKLQILKEGHHCDPEDEEELRTTLVELDPIMDSITKGDLQHDRGEIRRMEGLAASIADLSKTTNAAYCRPRHTCSRETNKCLGNKTLSEYYDSTPRGFKKEEFLTIIIFAFSVNLWM